VTTTPEGNPDILLLIGRMDGKLDLLLTRHDQHERRLEALEVRTAQLEGWKNRAVGWLAALAALAGGGAATLTSLLELLK